MAGYSEDENLADSRQFAELMRTLYHLKKPTIAMVQGPAFGGGVGLVSCCDVAIGTPAASFCFSEVLIGLIPAVISPYVIAAIGERAARRYFLTAERFSAETAMQMGLLSAVVKQDQLHAAAHKMATKLLNNSPAAIAAAKELIHLSSSRNIDDELIDETAQRVAAIRVSKEGQEGMKAFFNKQEPAWRNSQ